MISKLIPTERLRIATLSDRHATAMQSAAADRAIADTMISLPHPYPVGEALRHIEHLERQRESGRVFAFAIETIDTGDFCGTVEIRDIDREHEQGELSFWLARPAWGQGYMSEVLPVALRLGFEDIKLNRLYAHHMVRNPASGRVLEKNGFKREAVLRDRVRKWGVFEDVCLWAMLRRDWTAGD
ncbi:MAG: GNAT family protein [Pseudomonadota bacterium]